MNNYKKIKTMSIDEMTKLFYEMSFGDFCCNEACTSPENCQGTLEECKKGIKLWLQKECE